MLDTPEYYRVSLDTPPSVLAAFNNRKSNYSVFYVPREDYTVCEINYIQEGSVSEMRPGGEYTYLQGTVHTMVHNHSYQQYSKDPVLHEFLLTFRSFIPPEPMTKEEAAAWQTRDNEAILPNCITDLVVCEQISNLIKSVVNVYNSDQITWELKMRTVLYRCLAILTEQAVLQAKHQLAQESGKNPGTIRACEYIRTHLHEQMSVREVAAAAGVNYNHFKRVFARDMNMSMVEYINRTRIHRVEQLITVGGMNLTQASAAVGIRDPDYLSRLFLRYVGMNVQSFRRIYRNRIEFGLPIQE